MKCKDHDTMVTNIRKVWDGASDADMLDGMMWYDEAHRFAKSNAKRWNVSLEIAAGVIAAVSPRLTWKQNQILAMRIHGDDEAGRPLSGYLSLGLEKARRILNGEDAFEVLNGQKTRAFYQCIVSQGQTDIVCIDRHAMSIAYGFAIGDSEQNMTARQYSRYVEAYQDVARQVGVPAAVVQAVTWVAWRNR